MVLKLTRQGARAYEELDVAVATKTSNYTMTPGDHRINVDASGGAITITLVAQSLVPGDAIVHIKKVDSSANVVTIAQGG